MPVTARARLRVFGLLLALIATLSASGCARVEKESKSLGLESATNGYRQSIRWAYYEAAVGFLHPEVRGNVDFDALANVRVTSYEVVVPPVIDNDTAIQVVQLQYVLNDRQTVKQLADRQEWRYDAERESWWLHSGLPAFAR